MQGLFIPKYDLWAFGGKTKKQKQTKKKAIDVYHHLTPECSFL